MKVLIATLAAAGLAAVFAMPAKADATARPDGVSNTAKLDHTDLSAQRRHWRRHSRYHHRHHGYWGTPRHYYGPYAYGPYAYGPGVGFGFWGGPRFGVWF
jgi:hypothetical protein